MDSNRNYYNYARERTRYGKQTQGENNSFWIALIKQTMVCIVILFIMLYVNNSQDDFSRTVKAYATKILTTDTDVKQVFATTGEFWGKVVNSRVTEAPKPQATAETEASQAENQENTGEPSAEQKNEEGETGDKDME